MSLNQLERRCIDLSYRHKLSHISSVLNTVNLLDAIYSTMDHNDSVVLGNSHAALALYVILEKFGLCDANEMVEKHGTHAGRDLKHGILVSGGSLGQAETIAVGMAYGDRSKSVHLLTSDGACAEGAVWEALDLADRLGLSNLFINVIANGMGAYRDIDQDRLLERLRATIKGDQITFFRPPPLPIKWLRGLQGHYLVMNDDQYREAIND